MKWRRVHFDAGEVGLDLPLTASYFFQKIE